MGVSFCSSTRKLFIASLAVTVRSCPARVTCGAERALVDLTSTLESPVRTLDSTEVTQSTNSLTGCRAACYTARKGRDSSSRKRKNVFATQSAYFVSARKKQNYTDSTSLRAATSLMMLPGAKPSICCSFLWSERFRNTYKSG
jgi:hypothetical protein